MLQRNMFPNIGLYLQESDMSSHKSFIPSCKNA